MESAANIKAYYGGALTALRFVEARRPTGRRFGSEADARWAAFRGDLTTADRIDLLIRDADAQWPGAFAARRVFSLRAVAEGEPFGSTWQPLEPVDAEELWRAELKAPQAQNFRDALADIAKRWAVTLRPYAVPTIGAAEKLVVAGPSAVASVAEAFSNARDLDWADQVLVVATPAPHRQLAAIAAALLNAPKETPFATEVNGSQRRRAIISDDADAADAQRARAIGGAA